MNSDVNGRPCTKKSSRVPLLGGLGSGLAATALGGLAAYYFFIPPIGSLTITTLGDAVALALFCFIGAFMSVIAHRLRQARAEQIKREHEQRLATTLASIGDAVIATDVAGRITFMNPVAESLTGWNRGDASMKPVAEIFKIVNNQTRSEVESPVTKVLRQGMVIGLANHTILIRKDGKEVPIDDSDAPIRDKDGNTTGVVLVFRDITERKAAEEMLHQKEAELGEAQRLAHLGSWYWDASTDVTTGSDELLHIYGFDPQRQLMPNFREQRGRCYPVEDWERVNAAVERTMQTGVGYELDVTALRPDGQTIQVTTRSEVIRDAEGHMKGLRGTVQDITERRQAELALRDSEQRLRFHLENSPLAVVEWDSNYVVTTWSTEAERLFGWKAEETVGKRIDALNMIYEDDVPIVARTMERLSGGLERTVLSSNRNYTKSGSVIDCTWYNSVLLDGQGDMASVMSLVLDITARKAAEEALRKAHDELEERVQERTSELQQAYQKLKEEIEQREQLEAQLRQAQKMEALGTLSGGIAHDFNNILAAIIGFGELLQGHVGKDGRDQRHVKRVLEAALRGREVVKQLLAFSRKAEAEKKPLLLSTIVKETLKLLSATTPTTIAIRTSIAHESGLILADPIQIHQVLVNLCTNAVYAMRERGGSLDIDLSCVTVSPSDGNQHGMGPGPYMKLTVRDTGTGISPEIMDRIFDPFFTTKNVGEGTGLGLSVVHGIVKQSNGSITVEGEPGKGSAFTVYFPKIAGEEGTGTSDDTMIPTGTERILFVDDEEALMEMGEGILAELGYEVTSRTSSREALSLLKQDPFRFDLVITDQTMPDMTGIELAREVLALRADMPIIMCTGFSHLVDDSKAKAAGIRAFAMKPLTKREIARTARKVLDT
ncbi:MAG: PAS domain S-box protein [Syntrophorhabdales bacterium]